MVGAPLGNQNAAKGRLFKSAVAAALQEKSRVDQKDALQSIANKLIELASSGDLQAIKEIADRLDGKPKQQTELSGPDGGPVETVSRFKLADLE
jgi:hypothetical protein